MLTLTNKIQIPENKLLSTTGPNSNINRQISNYKCGHTMEKKSERPGLLSQLPSLSQLSDYYREFDPGKVLNALSPCKTLLITRHGPPDTHDATWACDAADASCNDGYGEQAKYSGDPLHGWRRLSVCIDKANLLHLIHDHERVDRFLTDYKKLRALELHQLRLYAIFRNASDIPSDGTQCAFRAGYVECVLTEIAKAEYEDLQHPEELLVKSSTPELTLREFLPFRGSYVGALSIAVPQVETPPENLKRNTPYYFKAHSIDRSVTIDEVPSIYYKGGPEQETVMLRLSRTQIEPANFFYKVETELLARLQLAGPIASDTEKVQLMMKTHPMVAETRRKLNDNWFSELDKEENLTHDSKMFRVRLFDNRGYDESIIDFMRWVNKTDPELDGFRSEGMIDMFGPYDKKQPRTLSAEVFLVGKQARKVARHWEWLYRTFDDRYTADMKQYARRATQAISEGTRVQKSFEDWLKDTYEQRQIEVHGNPTTRHDIAYEALRALGYEIAEGEGFAHLPR